MHGLPAALLHGAEGDQRTARLAADLLAKLALRRREEVLPRLGLALRDRPRALVLAREEGAAGVGEQDLETSLPTAVDEHAGAHPGGHRPEPAPSSTPCASGPAAVSSAIATAAHAATTASASA